MIVFFFENYMFHFSHLLLPIKHDCICIVDSLIIDNDFEFQNIWLATNDAGI